MKLIVLVFLSALAWFAVNGKGLPLPSVQTIPPKPALQKVEIDLSAKISENMTEEQKQQLDELGLGKGSMVTEIYTPVIPITTANSANPAAEVAVKKARNILDATRSYLERNEADIPSKCAWVSGLTALLLFALYLLRFWQFVRFITDFLFFFANMFLAIVSFAAPAAFFSAGFNPWQYASSALFWFPASLLLICATTYRFLDANFPVWKTLYSSMVLPALSGAAVFAKGLF